MTTSSRTPNTRAAASGRSAKERAAGGSVSITAPCRLHFGLLSFGHAAERQWGGVGVMVDHPAVQLQASRADRWEVTGPAAERASNFAEHWSRRRGKNSLPACRLRIGSVADAHCGLGTGTQLGLSVATALNALHDLPQPPPAELAISVGRGLRSAVGTYGFASGGLIVERGKLPGESIAPLDLHLDLPESWRFVLIRPDTSVGLSGRAEQKAFRSLPAIPRATTEALLVELRSRMLPAAARGDLAAFGESVYRYGRTAGNCFATVQGGPYNGRRLTELVQAIRDLGVHGVGQSSWGPTLFALVADDQEAARLVENLRRTTGSEPLHCVISRVSRDGAQWTASS